MPILAGLLAAGLVNYLSDTLPRTRRLSAVVCAHCGKDMSWNVYLAGLPCAACGHRRGPRGAVVLIAMLALSLYAWLVPHRMGYWPAMLVLTYFAVVIVIDVEHRLIMHSVSLAGGVLGAAIGIWLHGAIATAAGGAAGFALMLALYVLGFLFSRWRDRRLEAAGRPADNEEALGWGDVMLASVLGLLLGWPLIWLGLLLGILIGGAIGLIIVLAAFIQGRYGRQALMVFMPYGPAFVLSAFCILFLPNWVSAIFPK